MEELKLVGTRLLDFFGSKWKRVVDIVAASLIAGVLSGSFYLVFGVAIITLLVAFVVFLTNEDF